MTGNGALAAVHEHRCRKHLCLMHDLSYTLNPSHPYSLRNALAEPSSSMPRCCQQASWMGGRMGYSSRATVSTSEQPCPC